MVTLPVELRRGRDIRRIAVARLVAIRPGPGGVLPGSVTISGNGALYADIYAPQSNLTISGTGDLYGSLIGKSITLSGSAAINFHVPQGASGPIVLVK